MEREERIALWRLKPKEFNEWRRSHDIPKLFDYFGQKLPDFNQWVSTYFSNVSYLMQQDFPGRLIYGEPEMRLISYVQENGEQLTNALPLNHWISRNIRNRPVQMLEDRPYVPYIQWARRLHRRKPFIISDTRNKTYADNIQVMRWSAPVGRPDENKAYLFHGHEVLSLGNIQLPPGMTINGRNLDFTNLDFLSVKGSGHGNVWCYICYASCQGIKLEETQHAFMTFQNCPVHELEVRDSRLQDFEFEYCDIIRPKFVESYINGLRIRDSVFARPSFSNTELYEFQYEPRKRIGYAGQFDTMRRIRTAFQSMGRREESRKYYFFERVFERKAISVPFSFIRREFPYVPHGGRLFDLFRHWYRTNPSARWRFLRQILVYRATIWLRPKYLIKLIRYRLRYLSSLAESVLWGYGEKLFRPIRNALGIIVLFAVF